MKTYILKYDVYNNEDFPAGTIVTITDDYWGKGSNKENSGFTVIEGKLKGKKGCVADGLHGYLLDNTNENKKLFTEFQNESRKLKDAINVLNKKWNDLPSAILPLTPAKETT